ncbi:MAG: sugar phosphate isomerase/epimerase family protein [Candidatus Latescibacterota bacterium]
MFPAINPVYLTGSTDGWPLAELAELGYRGLELSPACLDTSARWQAAADRAGLRPVAVNALTELWPYMTGSLSDAIRGNRRTVLQRLLRSLVKIRKQGIPFLVVAPSRLAENYQSPQEARTLLIESLRELAAAGETTILLEAAPFRMFASSAEISSLVDEVDRMNVAAALDVGHAALNGEKPTEAAQALGNRLRYVQLHDADLRPGMPRLDRHLPFGQGSLDRAEVKAALGNLPFAFDITPAGDPLAAARAALAWLG